MPEERRRAIWDRLAGPWAVPDALEAMLTETDLDGLDPWIDRILAGGVQGRVLVRVS
jgi:alcohol dehydrogenase